MDIGAYLCWDEECWDGNPKSVEELRVLERGAKSQFLAARELYEVGDYVGAGFAYEDVRVAVAVLRLFDGKTYQDTLRECDARIQRAREVLRDNGKH